MGAYQGLEDPTAFLRTVDNVVIQFDPAGLNPNYLAFKAWLAGGNTPDAQAGPSMSDQGGVALAAKLANGIAITSTATPALNATYALDPISNSNIFQIGMFCAQFGVFPSGASTQGYPDANSVLHTFSAPQFVTFLRAVGPLVSQLTTQAAIMGHGGTPTWPAQTAVIA